VNEKFTEELGGHGEEEGHLFPWAYFIATITYDIF
jgi:hypothetical protein